MSEDDSVPPDHDAAEEFRALADAAPAILWETDENGACTFITRGWTDLTGQPGPEVLGSGWIEALHPDDREEARRTLLEANADHSAFQMEYRIRDGEGGYRWATAVGRPRFDASGRFVGYAGSTVDVDALKRAENELAESERRMRLAAEVARVGTFEWNMQTNVNMWTPELEKIYGLPAGSFEGTYEAWRACVHPDDIDLAERSVREALETGSFGAEWRIIRPDGQIRWIEARAWIFRDDDGRPLKMIGVNFDITDRKLAEDALRDAARRKDQFLAVLAHELRNPLAPIRNAAAVLAGVGPGDREVFDRTTAMIERQVAHLARLTDDLLDVSRVALGKVRLEKERLELGVVVREAIEDYRPYLESVSGVRLETDLPETPVWVDGDRVRISQAIGNLLHNAGKFTDAGDAVEVLLAVEGDSVRITVRDSGVGMSGELIDRLFEPFSQDDDQARNPGGLGLGLALVRGLAELHGGSATASSAGPRRGSEFTLRLPTADAPAESENRPERPNGDARPVSILLIEDHEDAAESLTMYLELKGHTVHVARDGVTGVDLASRVGPDVILCDLGLPGDMDGIAVAKAIRARPELRDTHLIALTGYGQARDRKRTAQAGFDRHLLKPVDLARLIRILDRAAPGPPRS